MSKEKNAERERFAQSLKELRTAKGWTQQQLADHLGLATGMIGTWETGRTMPREENLEKLAVALGVSPSALRASDSSARKGYGPRPISAESHGAPKALHETVCEEKLRAWCESHIRAARGRPELLGWLLVELGKAFPAPAGSNQVAFELRPTIIPKTFVEELVKQLGPNLRHEIEAAVEKMEVALKEEHGNDRSDHPWAVEQ